MVLINTYDLRADINRTRSLSNKYFIGSIIGALAMPFAYYEWRETGFAWNPGTFMMIAIPTVIFAECALLGSLLRLGIRDDVKKLAYCDEINEKHRRGEYD